MEISTRWQLCLFKHSSNDVSYCSKNEKLYGDFEGVGVNGCESVFTLISHPHASLMIVSRYFTISLQKLLRMQIDKAFFMSYVVIESRRWRSKTNVFITNLYWNKIVPLDMYEAMAVASSLILLIFLAWLAPSYLQVVNLVLTNDLTVLM